MFLNMATVVAQYVNLTGQWSANGGGLYTLDEKDRGGITIIAGTYAKPLGAGKLEKNWYGEFARR